MKVSWPLASEKIGDAVVVRWLYPYWWATPQNPSGNDVLSGVKLRLWMLVLMVAVQSAPRVSRVTPSLS
jgi:hypothetical protein